ncbi:MAG: hypothetical protein HQ523_03285 [Lentisphaerae bacterium]|nr:hypothetical protein [Lentisphaerota bacterium]
MNTSEDIDRLRGAEKEAQALVAKAQEEARRIRSDTESRVAHVGDELGQSLAATRERLQSEEQQDIEAFSTASAQRLASLSSDVATQLEVGKAAAVRLVVEELVAL